MKGRQSPEPSDLHLNGQGFLRFRAADAEEQQWQSFKELLLAINHVWRRSSWRPDFSSGSVCTTRLPASARSPTGSPRGCFCVLSNMQRSWPAESDLAGFRTDLPRLHLLHGTIATPLVPMENQEGPIVRQAILETM